MPADDDRRLAEALGTALLDWARSSASPGQDGGGVMVDGSSTLVFDKFNGRLDLPLQRLSGILTHSSETADFALGNFNELWRLMTADESDDSQATIARKIARKRANILRGLSTLRDSLGQTALLVVGQDLDQDTPPPIDQIASIAASESTVTDIKAKGDWKPRAEVIGPVAPAAVEPGDLTVAPGKSMSDWERDVTDLCASEMGGHLHNTTAPPDESVIEEQMELRMAHIFKMVKALKPKISAGDIAYEDIEEILNFIQNHEPIPVQES